MADITVKQKEAKKLKFTVTGDGSALDLSTSTVRFGMKKSKRDTTFLIDKADGDFDKTQASGGIITVILQETDLDQNPGEYVAELKIIIAADNIDKSQDLTFLIVEAVIKD